MISAIIVAAGRGTRMGQDVDKMFLEVAGRPVIAHTWQRFDAASCIDEIILVVREGMQTVFSNLASQFHFQKRHQFASGGQERQDSVWNGLQRLDPQVEWVAIQDGARPCTSETTIRETIQAAHQVGAAVSAQRVSDTIKESDEAGCILRNVDRSRLWAAQTPQVFRVDVICRALAAVRAKGLVVTDDTAACELIGQPVKLVENCSPNPKVTVPADLPYIDLLLRTL
jgi:2-C-methyl-D-erythritol 4-phosphate cytidylyltransferase